MDLKWFTKPLSRADALNLKGGFAPNSANTLPNQRGPNRTTVGSYSQPFAPTDLSRVAVLRDARNRVQF